MRKSTKVKNHIQPVRFPQDELEIAQNAAYKEDETFSEFVRESIRQRVSYLNSHTIPIADTMDEINKKLNSLESLMKYLKPSDTYRKKNRNSTSYLKKDEQYLLRDINKYSNSKNSYSYDC
jgi:hypothetical protein